MPRRIAVLGAGVAGLQAAALLKDEGYQVTIFEKSGDVGGVWQKNYAGYALQVRKWHYEIPGYPWVDAVSPAHHKYPTGPEVQAYLQAYARDAGLLPLARFHTQVRALRPAGGTASASEAPAAEGWEVEWADAAGKVTHEAFDFVVVATGLYNEPERPAWAEGRASAAPPAAGSGPWVVDARDFTDAALAKGKHVVVVGAGKTAHDVGVVTSKVAASTTLVARRGHWMAPQQVLGVIPFEFASYTRWSWALQPAWYAASPVKKAVHTLFSPVKAAAWGLFGLLFPLQTSTPASIKPRHGLLEGVYDTIGMVNAPQLSAAFKSGRLAARAGRVESLTSGGVKLEDGSELQADIVVLATGYRPTARSLFPAELQEAAGYKGGDEQWLYRSVLPPRLPGIAFIGQNATFQHVLTTALQSRWLVDVLAGELKLPPHSEQLADIAAQEAWLSKSGVRRSNNFVWAQHGKYHDALVADIRRGGSTAAYPRWNVLGEWFGYIKNQLYAPLFPSNASLCSGEAGIPAKVEGKSKGATSGVAVTATNAAAVA